jgi:hypothetical protein
VDRGQFSTAYSDFIKARDLYNGPNEKHTVSEELDLMWGLILSTYYGGDKKVARSLYTEIRKDWPEFATMADLKQLPLVWSQTTQGLITRVIQDFK